MDKKKVLAQQLLGAVLLIAVLVLIGALSVRYKTQWDWTAGHRNTLTEASRTQLKSMADPIKFVAFSAPGGAERGAIEFAVQRYQRFKKNVEVQYINPSAQPQKVAEYKVTQPGAVVLEYQGRRESLNDLSERSITTALQRLSYTGESWIVFLEGHGERSLEGGDPSAIAQFANLLREKGLKAQSLSLITQPKVPDNTSALVIASPKSALLPGEVAIIKQYVDNGGNLLWLADPETPPGLDEVAKSLGIEWQNGLVVMPEYAALNLPSPAIYAALGYPPESPVSASLRQITLFPFARAVKPIASEGWKPTPMLVTSQAAWAETGKLEGNISLNPAEGDLPGPLNIGLTLLRDKPGAVVQPKSKLDMVAPGLTPQTPQQRAAVVGDADFLSDAYLAQGGNRELALNLVQWLAARDDQLSVDIPKAPDSDFRLTQWQLYLIGAVFVFLLPLGLLVFGITRWALRRRR